MVRLVKALCAATLAAATACSWLVNPASPDANRASVGLVLRTSMLPANIAAAADSMIIKVTHQEVVWSRTVAFPYSAQAGTIGDIPIGSVKFECIAVSQPGMGLFSSASIVGLVAGNNTVTMPAPQSPLVKPWSSTPLGVTVWYPADGWDEDLTQALPSRVVSIKKRLVPAAAITVDKYDSIDATPAADLLQAEANKTATSSMFEPPHSMSIPGKDVWICGFTSAGAQGQMRHQKVLYRNAGANVKVYITVSCPDGYFSGNTDNIRPIFGTVIELIQYF
jgi:hypothetical protein